MSAVAERLRVDPVTLEVIRHGIISIADQIDANMTRTAYSAYIYEYKDYAVGLCGPDGNVNFWLGPPTGTETRELHVAFRAPDRIAVDAVHEAAVAAGVEVLHAPREFPEYHPGYYGVFLRDPDGHNVEAVHHG